MKSSIDHESLALLSPYELFCLRKLINHELDNPGKIEDISNSLHIGQIVDYFNSKHNNMLSAIIIEKKAEKLLVENMSDHKRWWTKYYTLNLDGIQIVKSVKKTLDRSSVGIGDLVGFRYKDSQISGIVTKLNKKTVKVLTGDKLTWTVGDGHLFAVVDVNVVDTRGMVLIDV